MAVTLVQSVVGSESSSASSSATLPSASTTGHTLVVGIEIFGNGPTDVMTPISSITDGTNTFTLAPGSQSIQPNGADYWVSMLFYYCAGITGGATETVTVTFPAAGFSFILLWELTASQFDQAVEATGQSSGPNAGAFTPGANGAFAAALFGVDGVSSGGWTPASGWTSDQGAFAGNGGEAATHIAQTTAAALSPGNSLIASGFWAASAVSFVPPSTGVALAPVAAAATSATSATSAPTKLSAVSAAVTAATSATTAASRLSLTAAAVSAATATLTAPAKLSPTASGITAATATVAIPSIPHLTLSASAVSTAQGVVVVVQPAALTMTAAVVTAATGLVAIGPIFTTPVPTSGEAPITTTATPASTEPPITTTGVPASGGPITTTTRL